MRLLKLPADILGLASRLEARLQQDDLRFTTLVAKDAELDQAINDFKAKVALDGEQLKGDTAAITSGDAL